MGSTGRNMPNVANPTQIKAMMFKMIFIFLFLTEVQICFWGLRVLELLISLRGLFCFFKSICLVICSYPSLIYVK